MKKAFLIVLTTVSLVTNAQQSITTSTDSSVSQVVFRAPVDEEGKSTRYKSPYRTSWKKDGAIIAAGVGLTALGTYFIGQKDSLTDLALTKKIASKVPFFDRHGLGDYDEKADDLSYTPFYASFIWPVVMTIVNKNERHNAFQVLAMYLETMAITGTMFTMSAGLVHRSRPYVYKDEDGIVTTKPDRRRDKDSQRSFYAGHTAATAASAFYTAKVFQDFNPDSKLKPFVWGVAAALPAITGYYRYKGGMHFLSDNLLGYGIGAATGILVPELHKNKRLQNLEIVPGYGANYKGISFIYHIK